MDKGTPEQPRPAEGHKAYAAASGTPDRQWPSASSAAGLSPVGWEAAVGSCQGLSADAPLAHPSWLHLAWTPTHLLLQAAACGQGLQQASGYPLAVLQFRQALQASAHWLASQAASGRLALQRGRATPSERADPHLQRTHLWGPHSGQKLLQRLQQVGWLQWGMACLCGWADCWRGGRAWMRQQTGGWAWRVWNQR